MKVYPRCLFALLALAGSLVGSVNSGAAQAAAAPSLEPQIVRLRYVEGDVRVARGTEKHGSGWEKAEVDLPLETGYSLATGTGRAEIEFEDSSTAYLGENSVLVLHELSSAPSGPRTEISLLSGVMSLNVRPESVGERFRVTTATDGFTIRYPDFSTARVVSYLDGLALTSLAPDGTVIHMNGMGASRVADGRTAVFQHGRRIFPPAAPDQSPYADWDAWVAKRIEARAEAMSAAMNESGLDAPIPGLAEMAGQGTFSPCVPYGMCWEPTHGWDGQEKAEAAPQVSAPDSNTASVSQLSHGGAAGFQTAGMPTNGSATARGQGTTGLIEEDEDFPCAPYEVRNLYAIDPATGKRRMVSSRAVPFGYPRQPGVAATYASGPGYNWAVCHAGTWIRRDRRYVWVVDRRRHHHPPIHWVETGKKAGFVPIHPKDVAGVPPINLREGVFHPVDKKGNSLELLAYRAGEPVKLLDEAPKEFRNEFSPRLAKAQAPRVEARQLPGIDTGVKVAHAAITFDHKSQSFEVSRQMEGGGKTVVVSVGSRGTVESGRGGGSSGSGGSSGGGARGGSSGYSSGGARGGSSSYSGGGSVTSHGGSAPSGGGGTSSGGGGAAAVGGGAKH